MIYCINCIINILYNYVNFLVLCSLDSKQIVQKYGSIIIDFVYFKSASTYEQKIESDPVST